VAGHALSDAESRRLWTAWTPVEVAERLSSVTAPWYVAAGWALDLFIGGIEREHADIEIGLPRERFDEVTDAFPSFEWDVVGEGWIWPFPEEAANHYQTWLREPSTGRYRLDVFREPHIADQWVCRRYGSITLPYDELILRTADGIPYVIPEVALLFKAKGLREKDDADFRCVLPALDRSRRARLSEWISQLHPGHPWLERLSNRSI
jgi:aminoglycoside-2''-adenylyltransferase